MTPKKLYALRTCKADMESYGGFKWPRKLGSKVVAPDWDPKPKCGKGLHGLLRGNGDADMLDWSDDSKWLVVEIIGQPVDIDGTKVKFEACFVRHVGDRQSATGYIIDKGANPAECVGCFLTGGNWSTLTGGDRSTLTGGNWSTLTGGYWSTLTGGRESTLTGGIESTLTGGNRSTLCWRIWDGVFNRLHTAYVGEDGIKPNTPYRYEDGKIIEAQS